MNKMIVFLLESSVILGVLYLIYYFLLRKEVSFNFNRFYLLGALVFSLSLPLSSFDFNLSEDGLVDQPIARLSDVRDSYQNTVEEWSYGVFDQEFSSLSVIKGEEQSGRSLAMKIILIVYAIGFIAMLFRLVWTLSWILKLRTRNRKERLDGLEVIHIPYQIAPFSFLNSVFVPEELRTSEEFTHILDHERTHVKQRHSLDLLMVQFLTTVLWFNPVIWWLNKSLKTTHEYIADRKMINKGYSLVEYQTLLLRQLISNNSFGLVHNFNLSFIKKRITMMNIQKLGGLGKFKIASVVALTSVFSLVVIQCNSKLEDQGLTLQNDVVVSLPVVETEYAYDIKDHLRFDITIKGDKIYFKEQLFTLQELSDFDGNFPPKAQIVLEIDKDQPMKLVYEVQEVLRAKDLRMLIYLSTNTAGETLGIPFMLPPGPDSKSRIKVPALTDEFIQENGIHMIEMNMSDAEVDYESFVYNGLKDPMIDKRSFVFRGRYSDDTSYENYLIGLTEIKEGFYKLYDERALEMFGKSFYDINREQKTSEEAKSQYRAVREGIPMSIVVERAN